MANHVTQSSEEESESEEEEKPKLLFRPVFVPKYATAPGVPPLVNARYTTDADARQ